MKVLYSVATRSFFKVIDDNFTPTKKEAEHIAMGQWLIIDIPNFDGNLQHYRSDGVFGVLLPESEWPENKIEEGFI